MFLDSNFKKTDIKNIGFFVFLALSLFFYIMSDPVLKDYRVKPLPRDKYLPPPTAIKYLTAGHRIQLADLFWLRALLDFDYCDEKVNQSQCVGKSWLFQMLNLTIELDPKMDASIYQSAGLALTVIISDIPGATIIFDKATQQYPDNWQINYAAAYHALFEEKNKLKASELYFQAAKNGAPQWVYAMAGRLALEGEASDYSRQILQQMIDSQIDEKIINKLKQKINLIK